jgi:hypothetical protein
VKEQRARAPEAMNSSTTSEASEWASPSSRRVQNESRCGWLTRAAERYEFWRESSIGRSSSLLVRRSLATDVSSLTLDALVSSTTRFGMRVRWLISTM